MRGILYDRVKRGVLVATVGASFLAPAAAQACPQSRGPAWGYWSHAVVTAHGHAETQSSGGNIAGHRIG